MLAQARAQAGQQPAHALRRLARGILERRELVDVIDHPEPVCRVDQQVRGVLDGAAGSDQAAQLVDDECRGLDRLATGVRLPADDADATARLNAFLGQDVPQRSQAIARLTRQAEVLEQVSAHLQRRGTGHPVALVADQDRGLPGRSGDQDRLLETRVEARQKREVRAVLSVGIDDQPVVAARIGARTERLEASLVGRCRDLWHRIRHAEVREVDLG